MSFLFHRKQGAPSPAPPPPPPPPAPIDDLLQPALASYLSSEKNNSSNDASSTSTSQVVQKGTLVTVANSIRRCVSGMSPWDISDLTLGLYKIATRHALEGTSDTISGSVLSDIQELHELLYWLDWAWASYLADKKSIIEFVKIEEHQLKKHMNTAAILKPAYIIAIDNVQHCVVLSIRGTYAATDVLTDLQPHSEKFEGGYAHSGMLSAAYWILENETENLQILMKENLGHKLVITGHSLGAGAASLLCFLLRESTGSGDENVSKRLGIPPSMIECWGYACPPCVDRELSEHAPFIKNVVLQDDIIARASIAALEDLRTEILQTDWEHVLEDGGMAKRMVEMVNRTQSTVGNVEQLLGYERGSFLQQAKSLSYASMVESFRASLMRGQHGPHGPPGHYGNSGFHGAPGFYGMRGPPPPQAMQGPGPPNLFGLLAFGASTISSYMHNSGNRVEGEVASDDVHTVSSREFMTSARLFVPGILYHIKRIPATEKDAVSLTNGTSTDVVETKEVSKKKDIVRKLWGRKNSQEDSQLEKEASKALAKGRHCVVKGDDPKSRFMKIVFSKSMLSDHSLVAYKDGIIDAIEQASRPLSQASGDGDEGDRPAIDDGVFDTPPML